jgi:hypothetical protein
MKQTLLIFLLAFSLKSYAQETSIFQMAGTSLYLSQNPNKASFPIYLKNSSDFSQSINYERPLNQEYAAVAIPFQIFLTRNGKLYLGGETGFSTEKYTGRLNTRYYNTTTNKFENLEQYEYINASSNYGYFLIGYAIAMDKNRKVILMPQASIGGLGSDIQYQKAGRGIYGYFDNPAESDYIIEASAGLRLMLSYQISKHFGLGLSTRDIIKLYRNERSGVYGTVSEKVIRKGVEADFQQVPRINFLVYF